MKELKLGKMTSRELADWMNVSYYSYRNAIPKYLKRLEDYADFEPVYGGVIIKEIYIFSYNKDTALKTDILFLQTVEDSEEHLTTISGASRLLQDNFENKSERTVNRQLSKSRDRMFGSTQGQDQKALICSGPMGTRQYVWAVKLDDFNHYRYMSEEEEQVFDALIEQTYGNIPANKVKEAALLDQVFETTDMTKEEYLQLKRVRGLDFFTEVIEKMKKVKNIIISRATRYDIEYYNPMFEDRFSPEEQEYRKAVFKNIELHEKKEEA